MAFGILRLDPARFWSLSLNEWLHTQRGFLMWDEQHQRREWERARMIAYYAVKPHVKRNSLQTFQSLMTFPWERAAKVENMSKEEMDYIVRKYGMYYNAETDQFVN